MFPKKEKTIENRLPIEKYIIAQTHHHFLKLSNEGMWDGAISIEIPHLEDGSIDFKNFISLMEAHREPGKEFFNAYCDQNLPFAMLAASEGGHINAIGRIQHEQRGFIRMSDGTLEEFKAQKDVISKILGSKESFYLDGTSAWILAETGLLSKLYQYIPNLKVPQSVISLLFEIKDNLSSTPDQVGQMFYFKGKVGIAELNIVARRKTGDRISEAIDLLEAKPHNIAVISSATKEEVFSEQKIPASLADATILSQRENIPILTEDFLYLHLNNMETGKSKPQYFSSIALMRVLYENKLINFQEYLDFFSYLASYRFRFLQITTDDFEKAFFGDGPIIQMQVANLRKLHLSLTLSTEYGVDPDNALRVVIPFILKLLIDDFVSVSIMEEVFTEIMSQYPTEKEKIVFSRSLIYLLIMVINKERNIISGKHTQEKIDALLKASEKLLSPFLIIPS
ncbi:MAG: hypothetical protein IPI46_14275 [Bacteroidetes bacterium]|nr:hypothetical protein [Bacteroidota bacterium]